jgi:hypothetical protein
VLRYSIEDAGVAYKPISKDRLERSVWLAMQFDLTSAGGRVLADERCRRTFEDAFQESAIHKVQPDPYPEARSALVRNPGVARFVEPVVLGAAMATIVYLFFTVRS